MVRESVSMKKIYLSDLHIGNGSYKDDFQFDEDLIELLDYAITSGCSEIVIVGDGLELMNAANVESMDIFSSYEDFINSLTPDCIYDIVSKHEKVFEAFRRFSRVGRIVYIAGNHDAYLLHSETLKTTIKEVFTEVEENFRLLPYYYDKDLNVFAIHGNQFDVTNRFGVNKEDGKLILPFGDYMFRYMLRNFDSALLENNIPESIINAYDDVHPNLDVFQWFEYMRKDYDIGIDLLQLWLHNFVDMLNTDYAKQWMKVFFPKSRHMAKLFVNHFGGMKLGEAIVRGVMNLRKFKRTDNLYRCGQKMLGAHGQNGFKKIMNDIYFAGYGDSAPNILPGELKGVIMGHNHRHVIRIIPVNGDYKFYANTGTWKPVISMIDGKLSNGFERREELTFIVVERYGDQFEIMSDHVSKMKGVVLKDLHTDLKSNENKIQASEEGLRCTDRVEK